VRPKQGKKIRGNGGKPEGAGSIRGNRKNKGRRKKRNGTKKTCRISQHILKRGGGLRAPFACASFPEEIKIAATV